MMWDEWYRDDDDAPENEDTEQQQQQPEDQQDSYLKFDFFSVLSKPKDYYRILEVDYDATDDAIRSNYIRLALLCWTLVMGRDSLDELVGTTSKNSASKWHPDKQKDQDNATSRFQEINEAYQVLSDPIQRREYDKNGMLDMYDYNIMEYLNRYKGLILTCNGLGIKHSICCCHRVGMGGFGNVECRMQG
ncbi:unnamed protein product [Camellia sinensis]